MVYFQVDPTMDSFTGPFLAELKRRALILEDRPYNQQRIVPVSVFDI
jgi:hypothetical protein